MEQNSNYRNGEKPTLPPAPTGPKKPSLPPVPTPEPVKIQ